VRVAAVLCSFCIALVLASVSAQSPTVWDGVYTSAQAMRGQTAYQEHCAVCHGDGLRGTDEGPALAGRTFEQHWFEDSLNNLATKIRTTMPADAPGSLPEAAYLDIVAYVLEENGFPAGRTELPRDAQLLARIQIVGKDGPGEVPDSALVQVLGCLARDGDTSWRVTRATRPVRTRDPEASAPDARAALDAAAPGTYTLRLLEVARFERALRAGQRAEVKGFLIRQPGGDRLNVTSLQTLGSTCDP
jgi:mono/diheme cytochrome c family protein